MRSWSSYHQSPSDDHQEYDVHGNLIVAEAGDFEAEPSTAGTLATAQANPKSQAVTGRIFGRKKKGLEFYKIFHLIMMFYLYLYCSRVPELFPSLHIGAALQPILLIGMIMTKTTTSLWKSDIGKTMFYFMAWVGLCVPFSVWKGGSFTTWLTTVQALVLLLFMSAFIRSTEDCFRAMYMVALAMATIGVLTLVMGSTTGGSETSTRLGLGSSVDTLSDANFLALYLVVGIPFIIFAMSWKRGFVRMALFFMLVPVLAGFARTGSRMGLLALGVGMMLFFCFATAVERIAIVMGGILFVALAITLLPQQISGRFTTYFKAYSSAQAEAAASAEVRKVLFSAKHCLELQASLPGCGSG